MSYHINHFIRSGEVSRQSTFVTRRDEDDSLHPCVVRVETVFPKTVKYTIANQLVSDGMTCSYIEMYHFWKCNAIRHLKCSERLFTMLDHFLYYCFTQ